MVSVIEDVNRFQLRDYYLSKIARNVQNDPFKQALVSSLNLLPSESYQDIDLSNLSLYQRCSISGLVTIYNNVEEDLVRLLGQASVLDSTPQPWVSDVYGVLALSWAVSSIQTGSLDDMYREWVLGFLPKAIKHSKWNVYERDIGSYLIEANCSRFSSAAIPLFLHYRKKRVIDNQKQIDALIEKFMDEYSTSSSVGLSTALLAVFVYVFDHVNKNAASVPPNSWGLDSLVTF